MKPITQMPPPEALMPPPAEPSISEPLSEELERMRNEEQEEHDRLRQEELARQQELARFD